MVANSSLSIVTLTFTEVYSPLRSGNVRLSYWIGNTSTATTTFINLFALSLMQTTNISFVMSTFAYIVLLTTSIYEFQG